MEAYYKEFEHPLWKELGEKAKSGGGHGGGDWLEIHRLIQAPRTGAARRTWTSTTPPRGAASPS